MIGRNKIHHYKCFENRKKALLVQTDCLQNLPQCDCAKLVPRWIFATEELASHSHSGSTASAGNHTHTFYAAYPANNPGICDSGSGMIHAFTGTTSANGNHSHSLTINSTGNSVAHNNMQPYLVVYRFQRSA